MPGNKSIAAYAHVGKRRNVDVQERHLWSIECQVLLLNWFLESNQNFSWRLIRDKRASVRGESKWFDWFRGCYCLKHVTKTKRKRLITLLNRSDTGFKWDQKANFAYFPGPESLFRCRPPSCSISKEITDPGSIIRMTAVPSGIFFPPPHVCNVRHTFARRCKSESAPAQVTGVYRWMCWRQETWV